MSSGFPVVFSGALAIEWPELFYGSIASLFEFSGVVGIVLASCFSLPSWGRKKEAAVATGEAYPTLKKKGGEKMRGEGGKRRVGGGGSVVEDVGGGDVIGFSGGNEADGGAAARGWRRCSRYQIWKDGPRVVVFGDTRNVKSGRVSGLLELPHQV